MIDYQNNYYVWLIGILNGEYCNNIMLMRLRKLKVQSVETFLWYELKFNDDVSCLFHVNNYISTAKFYLLASELALCKIILMFLSLNTYYLHRFQLELMICIGVYISCSDR